MPPRDIEGLDEMLSTDNDQGIQLFGREKPSSCHYLTPSTYGFNPSYGTLASIDVHSMRAHRRETSTNKSRCHSLIAY